ncbi:uncharacterized protein G2W53_004288 [Senna tora]|uniref:Uncharacterized protein n=1 Tax=Senna tora TaxID=362788 RepID=A0A834XBE8_9FABA|nr:uncharacterized protein G2W53_004288 [Senna tora]
MIEKEWDGELKGRRNHGRQKNGEENGQRIERKSPEARKRDKMGY